MNTHSKRLKTDPSRTKLIKMADSLASKYVRLKNANRAGIVKCFTCSYKTHWKKIQNGHYISRFYKYTRWHEDNMRPQCFGCNIRMSGNSHLFRENLVKEIGEQRVKDIETKSKILFKEKDDYIQKKIHFLEEKLKE